MNQSYGFDTLSLHAGHTLDSDTHSRAVPIYQTTAYSFDSSRMAQELFELKASGNIYARLSNPTNDVLEQRIAALEGGTAAVAFGSGHAAIHATVCTLAQAGDEIVSSICIYGGAISLLGTTLKKQGIETRFVDPDDLSAWENAVTDKTKAFFVETLGNPNANVADIEAIAAIAHAHGIPLIVDNTFSTPALLRPIAFGADIVVHSATKYLGGHGSSMAGLVVDAGKFPFLNNSRFTEFNQPDNGYHGVVYAKDFPLCPFAVKLRAQALRDFGACLSPFNAFLILQGIETLSLRMQRHSENALAVARWLEQNPRIRAVHYPKLEQNPYYSLAQKYLPMGASSVFTFEIDGPREMGAHFVDSLTLFSHVANVGDTRSLVIHPATTTHSQLSSQQLKDSGITEQTIRLSIGIENVDDIIADLDQALQKAAK